MAERPTAESERLYREACGLMPGGVSSPVRAFGAVGGHPLFIARGEGGYLVGAGGEATVGAVRLARAFTGRAKIVKFAGNYHGHADALLVKAGSGVATLGLPDSPGVPAAAVRDTLTPPDNHLAATQERVDRPPGA